MEPELSNCQSCPRFSTPPSKKHNQRRKRSLPHGRVIRLRLGIGGDIPRKLDARRERAALLAALPDVVRLGGARVGDDAGVFAGDGVAEGAAVGVVGAVLEDESRSGQFPRG